jgi:hypothetical protein
MPFVGLQIVLFEEFSEHVKINNDIEAVNIKSQIW